ncbi:MAG TPA: outer membrane protein assembly factor BamD [Bacteroidota bacterium]|nr:outer membrane protein assembly factor BamD [Bacteroidota bacterium]
MNPGLKCCCIVVCTMLLSSCSRKSDSVLYKEGSEAESQKNFTVAADRFEEVVDRFPATAYAESSLTRLSVIYSSEQYDARKALSTYQRYYILFPTSKQAPSMLFLVGYMYNNELHNLDSAKLTYELFLNKYPNDTLAQSARFELANLGKDLNQAVPQNVTETPPPQPDMHHEHR